MQPHPWFNPLYRRVLTMAFCVIWLIFEASRDLSGLWTLMALAVTAWGAWDFFLAKHYPVNEDEAGGKSP